jgi:hypothetical protein
MSAYAGIHLAFKNTALATYGNKKLIKKSLYRRLIIFLLHFICSGVAAECPHHSGLTINSPKSKT